MTTRDVVEYLLPDGMPRPRMRGWLHAGAAPVALALGVVLVVAAPAGEATWAALVYALSVLGLFAASATYHRGRWSPGVRAWMRRIDHSMIYVLIAGTYTPVCMLVLDGALGDRMLAVVWGGALLGVALQLTPMINIRWLDVAVYVALGWAAVAVMPDLWDELGAAATLLIGFGGVLYTAGAVVYGLKRPDPFPGTFGHHEIFHAFTIAAAAVHYAVIAFWVLPHG